MDRCNITALSWLGDRKSLGLVIVLALAVGCYVNSFGGDFVHDDIFAIKENQDLRPETPLGNLLVNDFWGTPMSSRKSHKSYRPLCVLTFRLNYLLAGLTASHYHVTNVLLHAVACLLVLCVADEVVFRSRTMALMAAMLFAVHPVHTEAVTGIVGRADVLACILTLASFILYHRSCSRSEERPATKWPQLLASVLCAACAMLCKEQGITVLGICLVYDWLVVNRVFRQGHLFLHSAFSNTQLLLRSAVVLVSVVVLLAFRLYLLNSQLPGFTDQDNPASFAPHFSTRLLTFAYLWAFNANLLTTAVVLSYDWQMGSIPLVESVLDPRCLATLVTFVSLAALSFQALLNSSRSTQRILLMALSFLVLPFLPASNLFFRVGFVVAERILYLPSVGFSFLVVFGMNEMVERLMLPESIPVKSPEKKARSTTVPVDPRHRASVMVAMVFGLLVAAMAAKTVLRNPVWWSRESLFRSGLAVVPDNAKVHYNYANFLKDAKRSEEAVQHYRTALRLYPRHPSACNNLATLVSNKKEAEALYRRTTELNPRHSRAYYNLGGLLLESGRKVEAEAAFRQALKIDENYGDALGGLSSALEAQGKYELAVGTLEHAVSLHPKNGNYRHNLAVFYGNRGEMEKSLASYEVALQLKPKRYVTWLSYARQLRQAGRNAEAEKAFSRALKIQRTADALQAYATMLHNLQRSEQAEKLYREALTLEPKHYNSSVNLAVLLSTRKEYGPAFKILLSCIESYPSELAAYNQLMAVYMNAGKHNNALAVFEEAVNKSSPSADTFDMHANTLHALKRTEEAIRSWKEAVRMNPSFVRAHQNLGASLHILKKYSQARVHYEKALQLEPSNQLASDNLARLSRAEKKAGKV